MLATAEQPHKFTPEEYFAWEEQQQLRHELIDGEVYAMTGGTIKHSAVAANLIQLLGSHVKDKGYQVLGADARVNIYKSNNYVYPDVSVTWDDRDRQTPQYITYPCLIAEVLSPSTAAYDRTDKFKMYRKSPILIDYVMINADQMEVDVYHKKDPARWEMLSYLPGDTVELESISLVFPIEQLYQGIIFTDEPSSRVG